MNMDDLIEQLDEALDGGFKMPGKRVVVDVEKVRAIVDDMRMTMPTEIKQAKGIVANRADIINDAKREADNILRTAEERANAMVAQEEITKLERYLQPLRKRAARCVRQLRILLMILWQDRTSSFRLTLPKSKRPVLRSASRYRRQIRRSRKTAATADLHISDFKLRPTDAAAGRGFCGVKYGDNC